MKKITSTITSKGQITIPIEIRELLNLVAGDEIKFEIDEKGVVYFIKAEELEREISGMIDKNELFNDIKKIIQGMKSDGKKEILTVDLIRKYQGNYYNANTSPRKSWNSRFGEFLKKNQKALGIKEAARDVNTHDDNGNKTSCSKWEIL